MRLVRTTAARLGGSGDPGGFCEPERPAVDAEALDAWRAFPVTRRPRPIVLIGSVLQEPGYATGDAKLAVVTGRLELATPLPYGPSRLGVRLPGGTFELPTISARAAFAAARAAGDPANAPDVSPPPLRITRVTLGTTRLATDRGRVTVPAWLFHAPGTLAPLAVPALDLSAFWRPGELTYSPDGGYDLTADGRLLTVTVPAPYPTLDPDAPYERYVPVVVESPTAVGIGLRTEVVDTEPGPPGGLDLDEPRVAYTVRLDAPLGNRVAVDGDGNPLPVTPA